MALKYMLVDSPFEIGFEGASKLLNKKKKFRLLYSLFSQIKLKTLDQFQNIKKDLGKE